MTSTSNSGTGPGSPVFPPSGFCAACGAALAAGARFCHRCGTPLGQGAPVMRPSADARPSGAASVLPWGVAFVALLALVASFAGKNFGSAKGSSVDGSANALPTTAMDGQGAAGGALPPAGGAGRGGMPDLASMSPSERASRLYIRAMTAAENGQVDSASFFAQMAVAAHGMIENISMDERYHMGRAAEIIADTATMHAQSDTILKERPTSLLGLMLASSAARARADNSAAKGFDARLLAALEPELATKLTDYELHRAEIDRAVAAARRAR